MMPMLAQSRAFTSRSAERVSIPHRSLVVLYPVDPALLSDARITLAMTDGTEFTLQDSWRARDSRPLPCRWTGKTVFIVGKSARTQVKIRSDKPVADDQVRRVQTVNGYHGHALKARDRVLVPAKSSACVATGLEFSPPGGVTARLQPLHGCGYDVCPAMYTYADGALQSGVDVFNPTDHDIVIEPDQDVAVVQFYTSVLTAVEFEFDVDEPCDYAAPGAVDSCGPGVDGVPVMPIRSETFEHRAPESSVFFYSACVARPVDRKERANNPKAKAALDKEWDKLIRQGCWDYSSVREWREISNEAISKGETAHVGRIFDICFERIPNFLNPILIANSKAALSLKVAT